MRVCDQDYAHEADRDEQARQHRDCTILVGSSGTVSEDDEDLCELECQDEARVGQDDDQEVLCGIEPADADQLMEDEAVNTIYDISGQRDTDLASDKKTPLMPSLMVTSPRREEFLM